MKKIKILSPTKFQFSNYIKQLNQLFINSEHQNLNKNYCNIFTLIHLAVLTTTKKNNKYYTYNLYI